jgi:hypothetical protein
MLITSLLLNAAACHLRDPSACEDPEIAAHNALHLAAAAITLQPRYGKAFYRAACAMGKLGADGDRESLSAAHAIMRYAAKLNGRPAAELLAHLPPLPPGAVEMPFSDPDGAMSHVLATLYAWPLLMRERAPAGQDFLLQLPGGLGPLPPSLVYSVMAACDAEVLVPEAMEAKESGDIAFMAGDTPGALSQYNGAIDHLRPLTALHLGLNRYDVSLAAVNQARITTSDPSAAVVVKLRSLLNVLMRLEIDPYQAVDHIALVTEQATIFPHHLNLPSAARLPGCIDMASLMNRFWRQVTAKFMEPYGGVEGLLVNDQAWKHQTPDLHVFPDHFKPFA